MLGFIYLKLNLRRGFYPRPFPLCHDSSLHAAPWTPTPWFPEYVTQFTLLLFPCRISKWDLFQTSTTLHSLNLFIGRWNWIFPISWLSSIAESNRWTYWWAVFMAWQAEKHRKDAFNEPNLIGREANGTKVFHSCFITASLTVHHWA